MAIAWLREVKGIASMDKIEITSIEQLKGYIGQEIAVSPWVLVTQEMVDKFADATGDHQFIHVDPERAKQTMFGGTVAHGFFTLSMLAGFLREQESGLRLKLPVRVSVNYGLNRVRFPAPVPVGKRIRNHTRLLAIEEDAKGGWVQITREQTVEIEGSNKPGLVAEWLGRFYF